MEGGLGGVEGLCLQQNISSSQITARLAIHTKHGHDAAYQYRKGTNQSGPQKCFTYVLSDAA